MLKRAYPVWRKHIVFLNGRVQVISVGYRCANSNCVASGRLYLSQAAPRLTVRGSSFALEVIVQIGYWRFLQRWTVTQIHEALIQERRLPVSVREVLNLIGVFLVLLRCTYHLRLQEHGLFPPARCLSQDAQVVAHICAFFNQRWARLFKCYAWPERHRTNNDLETFFGRLRTRQRQIQGRKSIHEFIIRYGEWAVFIDPTESYEHVLQRC